MSGDQMKLEKVTPMRKGDEAANPRCGFFLADNELIDSGAWARLTEKAAKVYMVLLRRVDRAERCCWPKVANIARESGVSRNSVFQALTELETVGLVKRDATLGEVNLYELPIVRGPVPESGTPPVPVPESGTPPVPESGMGPVPESGTQKGTKEEDSEKEKPSRRKRRDGQPTDPRVIVLRTAFEAAHVKESGMGYPGAHGRDGKMTRNLPPSWTPEVLAALVPKFFADKDRFYARRDIPTFIRWLSSDQALRAVRIVTGSTVVKGRPIVQGGRIIGYAD